MRIDFERSGGFAGMRLMLTLDTESLSPDEARELADMVDVASFFDLPTVIAAPTPGADRFHYTLTVVDAGRHHRVEMGETAVPDALWPLLRRLTALARSSRGSQAPIHD